MRWENLSNEELLKYYAAGEFKAFDTFFKRNSKIIFLFILNRIKIHSEAEEILQETFFRLHKYIHRYDASRKALNWVFTIAKNQILTRLSKHFEYEELDESATTSQNYSDLEIKDELENALSNLRSDEKELLLEKFINDNSYEEISSKRSITSANARQKISRLLKKIRHNLKLV